ncbi:MAG: MaoC family dehydratase N-terminal domain-containing protein [Tateyamaria sp.]|uniref:FAS1-like dehydratase domain-containing protein n=2 Tax=Tateyamaria sp. TaxID=1929288 RepID=UPI0032A01848
MQDDLSNSVRQSDVMDAARAQAMQVALGQTPTLKAGDALPPFFHQLYFWTPQPPDALGRDGHPKVGGLIPDMGLARRMWAGGRLKFEAPLRLGADATRLSFCETATHKQGRTGPLAFVTLRHEVWQAGALCLSEWQDLVYREDPTPDAPRPVAPVAATDEDASEQVHFDATLLFRYSALTFNGHRIHYDQPYAKDVEGYDGLVVHGPLLAQHLMLMAERALGPLTQFSFRATAPLTHTEGATLCRKGRSFWVRGPDGRLCMQAEA